MLTQTLWFGDLVCSLCRVMQGVPLHPVHLDSELVKGHVVVGVHRQFPIDGVSFILGNDLAGGKVLLNPKVTAVPLSEHPDDSEQRFPKVFSVCAVTRAMSKGQPLSLPDEGCGVELADSFMVDSGCLVSPPVVSPPAPSPSAVSTVSPIEGPGPEVRMLREEFRTGCLCANGHHRTCSHRMIGVL